MLSEKKATASQSLQAYTMGVGEKTETGICIYVSA